MMKKIFALVFVLLLGKMWGYSQGYPLTQNLGSDSTIVVSKGATQSRFVNIVFADTTAANNQRIKNYPGAQIATNGGGIKLWLRNQTATAWIPINTGSGNNIYTIDGTLTGNRTLTGGGYPLTFTGLDKFVVSADSIRFTTGALNLLLNTDSASLSKKISYDGNYHSDYKQFTLVDKGYVDSVVSSSPAGTVTSIATNNATGITGGTITSTGTLAIDTTNVIATKASVTAGLAGKLNISDTAAMLNPYLRAIDTTSLSNRINLKLNISDTASMLNNYLNNVGYGLSKAGQIVSADSATLSNYYLRRKDSLTATNPLGYVTKQILADTAAAIRSSDLGGTVTSVATNNGTGITGGTITTSGTLAIDTLLISTRAWRQKGVDSVAALVGAGYVPYVGATDTLDMGQFGIKTKYLELDTSTRAVAARTLQWSNDNGTLAFGMTNGGTIEQDIGLQQFARVRNVQGSQINKGQVVYLYGASGDRAAVKLADNRNDSTSSKTLGIAVENIANGGEGFVGTFGTMSGLNLSTYTPGDVLYLDSIPGGLTATKPQAPYHLVFVGVVERANSGNGLLFTNPQNGYELEELHNVRITKPVRNNAILVYDSTASLWVDTTISQAGLAVTNIATNASTGILGGPITTTGTISADTLLLSTRLWRQKGIDSVQANLTAGLALKVNISDTASMLTPYLRKVDTTAMLANYVNNVGYGLDKAGQVVSVDTLEMSTRAWRQKGIDSVAALINNNVSGIAGYVSKFSGTNTIDTSQLFQDGQNLGIGTTTPNGRLAIVDTGGFALKINYNSASNVSDSNAAIYAENNGLSSYVAIFNEKTTNNTGAQLPLLIESSLTTGTPQANMGTGMDFGTRDDANNRKLNRFIIRGTDPAAATYTSRAEFRLWNNGTQTTPYYWLGNGNMGLGTSTPDSNLTVVNGALFGRGIRASGLPQAPGTKALRIDASGTISYADTLIDAGGTVTSVATNTGTGITGGTITTSGTLAIDTLLISTRAWRQKGIDSVQGNLTAGLALKVNISDTSSMLSPYLRKIDTTAMLSPYARKNFINAGTGISYSSSTGTIANTAPDQTVALTGGTGISISGTYPNFTITNSSPSSGGTVTSVGSGTGLTGGPITTSGTLAVDTLLMSTRAWRQKGIDSVAALANSKVSSVSGTSPISSSGGTSPTISISQAGASTNGFLSSTDWNTFNNKGNGTVTSVATNTGTGITGGTFTTSGTIAADTLLLSTRAWRQKGIDSVQGNLTAGLALKVNISDTSSMLSPYLRKVDTASLSNRINLKLNISDTSTMLGNYVNNVGYGLDKAGQVVSVDTLEMSTRAWRQKGIDSVAALISSNISGTTNYIPKFTSSSAIGNSNLQTDASGNLGLGVTPSAWGTLRALEITGGASLAGYANNLYLGANYYFNGSDNIYLNNDFASRYDQTDGTHIWYTATNGTAGNIISFTQAMTLDASGRLGVGIISPAYTFHAVSSSGTIGAFRNSGAAIAQLLVGNTVADLQFRTLASGDALIFSDVSKYLAFGTNGGTEQMRITSGGNVGLGVTPSAWASGGGNLQLKSGVNISWSGQDGYLAANQYYNGTNSIYISNGFATQYAQETGVHKWLTAPSGTAGNAITFTQAMTLNASGKLSVGTTATHGNVTFEQTTGEAGLAINSSIAEAPRLYLRDAGGAGYSEIQANNKLYINSANVGIGTTNPSNKLDVYGTSGTIAQVKDGSTYSGVVIDAHSSSTPFTRWSSSGTGKFEVGYYSNQFYFNNNTGVNNTNAAMVITSGSNVGIGTTNPTSKLEINSNSENIKIGAYSWIANYINKNATASSGNARALQIDATLTASANSDNLVGLYVDYSASVGAYTGVKQYAIYQPDNVKTNYFAGNVGIGTTSPNAKLELNSASGNTQLLITSTSGTYPYISLAQTGVATWSLQNVATSGLFTITEAGVADRLVIAKTSGNVGIGTTNPALKLTVLDGAAGDTRQIRFGYSDSYYWELGRNDTKGGLDFVVKENNTPSTKMFITSGGNVGIGTTSPAQKLDVNGVIKAGSGTIFAQASGTESSGYQLNAITLGYDATNTVGWITAGGAAARTNLVLQAGGGNVGIGTSSPLSILHILGQSGTTGLPSLLLYGEAPANGQRYGFNVSSDQLDVSALGANARIAFFTGGNASSITERMRITSGGEVQLKPAANTAALSTSGSYSLTGANAQSLLDLAGTWNTTGNPTAIKLNITNTASGATSNLMDLQVGGTSQFLVDKAGGVTAITFSAVNNSCTTQMGVASGPNGFVGTFSNHNFLIYTNNNERLRITTDGELQLKPAANTVALSSSGSYSLTGSNAQSLIDLAGTWNTTGNPTAIKLNITNTASGATSNLMDLQVGGTSQFLVDKSGNTIMTGSVKTGAPSGGTADTWKLGTKVASSVVLDDNNYLEVEVGGVAYRVALVNLAEPEPEAAPLSSPDGYVRNYGPVATVKLPSTSEKVANLEKEIAELRETIKLLKSKIK